MSDILREHRVHGEDGRVLIVRELQQTGLTQGLKPRVKRYVLPDGNRVERLDQHTFVIINTQEILRAL